METDVLGGELGEYVLVGREGQGGWTLQARWRKGGGG